MEKRPKIKPITLPAHFFLGLLWTTCLISWILGQSSLFWLGVSTLYWSFFGAGLWALQKFFPGSQVPGYFLVILALLNLYVILGFLPFEVIAWNGDPFLARTDQFLGWGTSPSVILSEILHPTSTQVLAWIYALFIPYVYLSVLVCLLGRPAEERRLFVCAVSLTYAVSFLGYLFLPARGPILFLAEQFQQELQGGWILAVINQAIDNAGGPHGAFPSLHVGAAWCFCFFDLRRGQLRGLIFLPLVLGICIATVALRYHYVIDVIAGILIATSCNLLAEKWMHWEVKTISIRARAWRIFLRCFYGHIEVVEGHFSKIEGPTLVVSNHANAFVDPLMLQTAFAKKCRFTAKASLLRNPLTWLLMKGFGAIPLARPQDHDREERQKNNESAFQACIEALSQGQLVCIFPEGKSHSEIRMLPLKTGAARIAKAFLEQSKGSLNILPVGLNYEKKAIFGSEVQIHFGPPLKLGHADFDVEDLTEQILASLKSLTLNYEDESTSTLIPWIAKLLSLRGKSPVPIDQKQVLPKSWVRSVQMIIEKENENREHSTVKQLKEQAAQLQDEMRKCNVNPESLFLPMTWGKATYFVLRELEILIFAIVFLPFFAAIWVPMTILRLVIKKVTKDEDHFATHFLFLGFPFMAACWLLVGLLLWYFQFNLFMLIWMVFGPFTLFTYIQCAMRWGKARARTKDFFNLLIHRQKAQHFRAKTIDLSDRLQKLLQSD